MSNHKVIRMNEVLEMTGLSRATVNRFRKEGSFPTHIDLGARAVGWFEADVVEWLKARLSAPQSVQA